jgi:hypothetical protein
MLLFETPFAHALSKSQTWVAQRSDGNAWPKGENEAEGSHFSTLSVEYGLHHATAPSEEWHPRWYERWGGIIPNCYRTTKFLGLTSTADE